MQNLTYICLAIQGNNGKGQRQDNRKSKNKNKAKKVKNTKPSAKSPRGSEVAPGDVRVLYTAPPVGASQGLKTECGSECGRGRIP